MNYGRYQVREEVGQGSMGLVYRAHDPQIDREVALKVLRRDRITGESFVSRFLKEARVIGRLSHPNIVTVYDVGQEGPDLYIAMEFIEGSPLNDILRIISLSLERIIEIGIQAAQTLDYAHQKGVVHRDIKPSNILLQSDKNIKITDFGIAHLQGSTDTLQTREGEIMGTPAYMSPEQVLGKSVDGRADIFSLGAVLYELATGRKPFGGVDSNIATVFNGIMNQDPPEPAFISDAISKDLSAVIMKCLRKEPGERFQTGNELAQALKACLTKPASDGYENPPAEKKKKNYVVPAVVAAAAAVLILAGGIYFYDQQAGNSHQTSSVMQKNLTPPPPPPSTMPSEVKQKVQAMPAAPAPVPEPAPAKVAPVAKPAAESQKREPKPKKMEEKSLPVATLPEKQPRKIEEKKQSSVAKGVKPSVALTPVTIISNPPGANAYIDDKLKGKTPLTLMLAVGKHNIRMTLSGYRDVRKEITIEETMEYPLSFHLKTGSESD